jgi:aminopeptidase YwaD
MSYGMYKPIWQVVDDEISGERAAAHTQRIWQHARWNSFDRMQLTAKEIATIMQEIGLEGVEVIQYPADGVTNYGGWVMPQAWDVEDAWLEIVEPSVSESLIVRYRDCPHSLMMYSTPTPPEGVVAEVVVVDEANRESSYEGLDLVGKLALIDSVGIGAGMRALEKGAVGLISDAIGIMGTPSAKTGDYLERAIQFHNYTIPPWRWERKGFGFSIPPAAGRRLRELINKEAVVKLRAVVRTRLYDGVLPLVTGLLPGRTDEEIVITAHLCEPGANDNCSGCAVGLEVVRSLRDLIERKKLDLPRRGIRLVYSFEVRGYQVFLATHERIQRFIAGINLDMVGNDLSDARATCNVVYNFPSSPAYTDVLALELAGRLQRESPLFRYRPLPGELVDNLFGEPLINAPMCVIGSWPDAYYHTSLDTPDNLSPTMLRHIGQLAATYCYFLADAGFEEAVWLAHAVVAHAEREIQGVAWQCEQDFQSDGSRSESVEMLNYVTQKNVRRLRSIARLVGDRQLLPTEEGLRKNEDWLCPWSHLFKDVELQHLLEEMGERIQVIAHRQQRSSLSYLRYAKRAGTVIPRALDPKPTSERPAYMDAEERRAKRLVPKRAFVGSLCFESLNSDQRRELEGQTGLSVGWGAPYWLQLAAFWSNGKRTAWDILGLLRREVGEVPLAQLVNAIELLARHGFFRLRPVLKKEDFLAAFKRIGIRRGQTVMVHSSLSRFGFVEGGEDAAIDALLEAIGPRGTLVMPTLSFSWIGHPPYDPRRTPSQVGAITESFRRRPGVLRSPHPTHSVAALGPKARAIVSVHSPDMPVFSKDGAFGKLYGLDARILMLAPLGANTIMHMAEEWAGVPFPDFRAHVMKRGKRIEVMVKRAPWHANFEDHYRVLFERGLIQSTAFGEGEIYYMRARDAVDVALENVRHNPLMVTVEGCSCDFCQLVREKYQTT